ncbi:hypothetical protein CTI12_AA186340 [Artemisia annua]|uniref:Uncharacterized protein n=1 Tax=Artemisia annua TaxID=35608 RepID=A0A2U1NJX5_ARTAN|nr:hypothetical protein CTI12_AA186340 [Artemisia annua]
MSAPAVDEFSSHSDSEESQHNDAASESGKPKQQQQIVSASTTISNIKLPILKKEEYDIWAMEMEHYLEYIDNDVWVLPPISAAEIHAEHLRRCHGMDDAKEIWEAIRTRFGGNANSKKRQKAVLKKQFKAFTILSSEGLEKGYDRFQHLLSQLEAHGSPVPTEDANHKFIRSLPAEWSTVAMSMRFKEDVDTWSIDDLFNNLRVFEWDIKGGEGSKTSSSAANVAFVGQGKTSTNKVNTGGFNSGSYASSSSNIRERDVPAGFADELAGQNGVISLVPSVIFESINHSILTKLYFAITNEEEESPENIIIPITVRLSAVS